MKTILIFAASVFVAVGAFAQGTILFGNNAGGATGVRAPIYNAQTDDPLAERHGNTATGVPMGAQTYSGALLAGTGFTCQLWGKVGTGVAEASLELLASTTFRTGTAAGFINTLTTVVPNAPIDGNNYFGTFQVRAWNNVGGTVANWQAVLDNPSVFRGASEVFSPAGALGNTGTPAATPGPLIGLTSFNIHQVPEPSAIALGVIGLGSLMFLRRRK